MGFNSGFKGLMMITSLQLISGSQAVSNKKYKCWAHEDKKHATIIILNEIFLHFR